MALGVDPVDAIVGRARELVVAALDEGWTGPPFDPFLLASFRGIEIVPSSEVRDAKLVPLSKDKFRIEYNPNRSNARIRYSIAHELGHTLFPDCAGMIRHRGEHRGSKVDDWQVETLCNVAAAEFLMPIGSLPKLNAAQLGVDGLLRLRDQYEVSAEAVFIRAVHVTAEPCAVFCASREEEGSRRQGYDIDYLIGSRAWSQSSSLSRVFRAPSVVAECDTIGFTAKGDELLGSEGLLHVEAVGLPSYPGRVYPRVLGILTAPGWRAKTANEITYLVGDAMLPRGTGRKIIAHVVNDATSSWGGRGFASALRGKWPVAQTNFRQWVQSGPSNLHLGNLHLAEVEPGLSVASLIAQRGYGKSVRPRISYAALTEAFAHLATAAKGLQASIHMPLIGTGLAGGSWGVVEFLINATLCADIPVFVYRLPENVRTRRRTTDTQALAAQ